MMNMQLLTNKSLQIMIELTFIDKLLIRWGIVTKNYKKYAEEMQRELDYQHLTGLEFWDKYYFDHDYK